jgi:hypothetical protein
MVFGHFEESYPKYFPNLSLILSSLSISFIEMYVNDGGVCEFFSIIRAS